MQEIGELQFTLSTDQSVDITGNPSIASVLSSTPRPNSKQNSSRRYRVLLATDMSYLYCTMLLLVLTLTGHIMLSCEH